MANEVTEGAAIRKLRKMQIGIDHSHKGKAKALKAKLFNKNFMGISHRIQESALERRDDVRDEASGIQEDAAMLNDDITTNMMN